MGSRRRRCAQVYHPRTRQRKQDCIHQRSVQLCSSITWNSAICCARGHPVCFQAITNLIRLTFPTQRVKGSGKGALASRTSRLVVVVRNFAFYKRVPPDMPRYNSASPDSSGPFGAGMPSFGSNPIEQLGFAGKGVEHGYRPRNGFRLPRRSQSQPIEEFVPRNDHSRHMSYDIGRFDSHSHQQAYRGDQVDYAAPALGHHGSSFGHDNSFGHQDLKSRPASQPLPLSHPPSLRRVPKIISQSRLCLVCECTDKAATATAMAHSHP